MRQHTNREAWLLAAVDLIRPIFLAKHYVIPADVMVSCGFASTGSHGSGDGSLTGLSDGVEAPFALLNTEFPHRAHVLRLRICFSRHEGAVDLGSIDQMVHQKLMPNGSPLGIFFAESRKHAGVRAETCGLR